MGIFAVAIAVIPILAVNEMRKSGSYTTSKTGRSASVQRRRRRVS